MKQFIVIIWGLLATTLLIAQGSNLEQYNQERWQLSKKSMLVLGGWAAGNIGFSGIMMTQTEGENYYFHQMNVAWNSVNLAIAGLGYWGATRSTNNLDLYSTIDEQHKIQKILLLNTGLDVAYMASGVYLLERAKNDLDNADRWNGFGKSLMLQGGFLLVFDIVQYQLHANRNKKIKGLLHQTNLSFSGSSLGISIQF